MSDKPRKIQTWVWVVVALVGLGILAVIGGHVLGILVQAGVTDAVGIGPEPHAVIANPDAQPLVDHACIDLDR